jgi:DNA repair exonuclease SbcCD ATPase subunit
MKQHLLSILGVGALFSLVAADVRADSRSDTLAEIEVLTEKIATLEAQNAGAVQLKDNVDKLKEEISQKKEDILMMEKEISDLAYLLSVYQSSYRVIPKVSAGTPLGTIRLANGTVIENGVYSGTLRGGIKVATAAGSQSIPVAQIPATHADKFNLPGALPAPSQSPEALAAIRPNEILGVLVAEASAGEEKDSKGSKSNPRTPDRGTPDERAAEYRAMLERNKQRWNRIGELKDEARRNNVRKKELRAERMEKQAAFDKMRIKPDRNKVESVLGAIDKQIKDLDQRDADISKESREVRMAIE